LSEAAILNGISKTKPLRFLNGRLSRNIGQPGTNSPVATTRRNSTARRATGAVPSTQRRRGLRAASLACSAVFSSARGLPVAEGDAEQMTSTRVARKGMMLKRKRNRITMES
jgi:hypothetical protein